MPSIIVSKPRVAFSERRTDPSLCGLPREQLLEKAHKRRLDVSRLTEDWEIVHVLLTPVQEQVENSPGTKGLTFFHLPGEIRNKIYGHLLAGKTRFVSSGSIKPKFNPDLVIAVEDTHPYTWWMRYTSLKGTGYELVTMSVANRQLRKEVRSFFFAHNPFGVNGSKTASHYNLLSNIGADGRANISQLCLDGKAFQKNDTDFERLLSNCVNLQDLKIRLHVGNIVDYFTYKMFRRFVLVNPKMKIVEHFITFSRDLSMLTRLPALQKLSIMVNIPDWEDRWSAPQAAGSSPEDQLKTIIKRAVFKKLEQTSEKSLQVKIWVENGGQELDWDVEHRRR